MTDPVVGVLLAGGLSRRMGTRDKMLRRLDGRTILSRVIERIRPQVAPLILNANGDPGRFAEFGLPVVADSVQGHAGPLAGVLAGMDWAAANAPASEWVVTVPTDAPFLPGDLVERMMSAAVDADMVCAASGGRTHPVCGLWPVRLRDDLRRAMLEDEIRKVDIWTARHRLARAEWPLDPIDPFFNANTPGDLSEAERLLAGQGSYTKER